jgi:hypothetical protein
VYLPSYNLFFLKKKKKSFIDGMLGKGGRKRKGKQKVGEKLPRLGGQAQPGLRVASSL